MTIIASTSRTLLMMCYLQIDWIAVAIVIIILLVISGVYLFSGKFPDVDEDPEEGFGSLEPEHDLNKETIEASSILLRSMCQGKNAVEVNSLVEYPDGSRWVLSFSKLD